MNVSSLFGSSGGGSFVSDPKFLPIQFAHGFFLRLKDYSSIHDASSSLFWSSMARFGATHTITTTGYETIVDITGGGFLANILAPCGDGMLRVTVDGVEHTLEDVYGASDRRMIVGPVGIHDPLSSSGYPVSGEAALPMYNGAADWGFNASGTVNGGKVASTNHLALITPTAIKNAGLPMLRFEKSLKIEASFESLSATNLYTNCGATYILD